MRVPEDSEADAMGDVPAGHDSTPQMSVARLDSAPHPASPEASTGSHIVITRSVFMGASSLDDSLPPRALRTRAVGAAPSPRRNGDAG